MSKDKKEKEIIDLTGKSIEEVLKELDKIKEKKEQEQKDKESGITWN